MINNKKTSLPKSEKLVLKVSDFTKGIDSLSGENITDFDYAISSYNFNFSSGVLTEGLGFKNLSIPTYSDNPNLCQEPTLPDEADIDYIWHFKQFGMVQLKRLDKLLYYAKNNKVYYGRLFTLLPQFYSLNGLTMTSRPLAFNHKLYGWDNTIMSNGTDSLVTWNGETIPNFFADAPKIMALCEHKGKLFATVNGERNFIRYSSNTNINEWLASSLGEGDGVIEMNDIRGPINKLLSFQGYLFAFRDYGIGKITTYENSDNYTVSQLFSSGNKIYADTVTICGDTILMLNKDGLFEFDGVNTEKFELKINKMFKGIFNENAVASYHSGIYYLACKLNFNDENTVGCESGTYKNNALIAFNVKTKEYTITRGIDITSMTTVQIDAMDKVIFCFNSVYSKHLGELTENGKFFTDDSQKYWCSPLSDLGYSDKIKVVNEISLMSKYDCVLKVFTESEERTINVKGANVISKYKVRLKGKQVGFSVFTDLSQAYISNVKLKVDLLNYEFK